MGVDYTSCKIRTQGSLGVILEGGYQIDIFPLKL